MKMSRRAARMERHHRRGKGGAVIQLVSLMDIFTILVFFLLVNSSSVQTVPSTKTLKLPASTAERAPRDTVTILVNNEDILVQGRKVAVTGDALRLAGDVIPDLLTELNYLSRRNRQTTAATDTAGNITIMGDKEIPYLLLKKIMITCTKANFTDIALAVMHKQPKVE